MTVVAQQQYASLPRNLDGLVDPTYATLLKIGLIENRIPASRFQERIDALLNFMENDLNGVLGIEIATALATLGLTVGIPDAAQRTLAQHASSMPRGRLFAAQFVDHGRSRSRRCAFLCRFFLVCEGNAGLCD